MANKTELIIADADKPLAFLDLDDTTLGKFARAHLIQMERAVQAHAGANGMPIDLVASMHGSISLYKMAAKSNAGELTLKHDGVEWGGKQQGDWTLTIKRIAHPPETKDA